MTFYQFAINLYKIFSNTDYIYLEPEYDYSPSFVINDTIIINEKNELLAAFGNNSIPKYITDIKREAFKFYNVNNIIISSD